MDPGKPLPQGKPTLLQTHLTRNIPAAKPMPADETTPFFRDVGGGGELFAVRRGKYYALLYAGKRIPFWMDWSLDGVMNISGGGLTGLHVQDVGSVLMGRHEKEYGWPIEDWEEMAVPAAVGQVADGRVFNTGLCRNKVRVDPVKWTLAVSGEAVSAPVNFERSYAFGETEISAFVSLRNADMNTDVFQYRNFFRKSPRSIRFAWELIPFVAGKETTLTCLDAAGRELGELAEKPRDAVSVVVINVGGGGVRVTFDNPRTVKRAKPSHHRNPARSLQVKICDELGPGATTELRYTIVPFTE